MNAENSSLFLFLKSKAMAYNQQLANRIREQLQDLEGVEEKEMMGGLSFLLNDKMCVGIIKDEMMCRIDPTLQEEVLEKSGCRVMDFTGKPMRGWIMIDDSGMKNVQELRYWIGLALEYNKHAKSSKKKK
jgi:TfoX/Sxy family transcriptional regulator of competence genes